MDEIQTIERGGRRWLICPAAAEPLPAAGWPPDHPEHLALIKQGRGRTIRRFEAGGSGFIVKAYTGEGLWRKLRARLGLGPGRREWRALLAARAAGVDVPGPVALACGAAEVLVTHEIPGARRLDEYLFERYFEAGAAAEPPYPGARPPELVSIFRRRREPPTGTLDPRALAHALANLVARLAEADLYLPDLHPGNILISGEPGPWRLTLVDLAEAEHPAPPESLMEHLLQLEHFFEPIASLAERLRCLRRVREILGAAPDARQVAHATANYRREFYRHRDRRTKHESKYFRRIKVACAPLGSPRRPAGAPPDGSPPDAGLGDGGAWRGWAAADWADAVTALLAEGAPSPGRPAAILKPTGRTSEIWRLRMADGRPAVLKRDRRASHRGPGRGLIVPTRATAAFRKGHALLARGIATARPAAAADLWRRGAVADSLLVTEAVDGEPLSDWLRHEPAPALRRRLARDLAQMLRRMHDAGFSHRDLKAPNILVSPREGPGLPAGRQAGVRPVLVDLDGLRQGMRASAQRRARDLMRLSVSLDEWGVVRRTDRLRFLRAYLGRRGCPGAITTRGRRRGDRRAAGRLGRWWRRIARMSERKAAALRRKKPAHGT
jgi:tRNA A-37 threonylcarbamoyl transferase component Bud32